MKTEKLWKNIFISGEKENPGGFGRYSYLVLKIIGQIFSKFANF